MTRYCKKQGLDARVDPQDIEGIGRMLRTALERVANQEEPAVSLEAIRRYERPRLAAELGQLLRIIRDSHQRVHWPSVRHWRTLRLSRGLKN